jgi:hypothetical protein
LLYKNNKYKKEKNKKKIFFISIYILPWKATHSIYTPKFLHYHFPFKSFFFPFPNHQPLQIPFLFICLFFPSLKILDKRVRVILSSLLSWCWRVVLLLVQGNSVFFRFLFMHDHHHLVIFLLALFWYLGFWRKFWIFLLSDTNTNLDLKDCIFPGTTLLFRFQRWDIMQNLFLCVSFFLVAWHCYRCFFGLSVVCFYPEHWPSKDMGFCGFWSSQECAFFNGVTCFLFLLWFEFGIWVWMATLSYIVIW